MKEHYIILWRRQGDHRVESIGFDDKQLAESYLAGLMFPGTVLNCRVFVGHEHNFRIEREQGGLLLKAQIADNPKE